MVASLQEMEENIICRHRWHIDDMVETVKKEMQILQDVDKPGAKTDEYI